MTASRRILYLQYTDPTAYPPLEHSSGILAERGWEVLFLGVRAPMAQIPEFAFLKGRKTILFPAVPDRKWLKVHYPAFAIWVIWKALWFRPNWIYASDTLSCAVAFFLRLILGPRLLYHEHDSPSSPGALHSFRAKVAKQAAVCVLPQPERARIFAETLSPRSHPHIVFNCPRLKEIPKAQLPKSPPTPLLLHYQGSIGPDRVPLTLLRALIGLPVQFSVLGYFPTKGAAYQQVLKQEAERLGVTGQVHLLGTTTREEMLKYAAAAHVGVSLLPLSSDDINMKHMAGASNKAFENLAFGSPLLVSDLPDWKEWFVTPGFALACDPTNADSIAKALRWLVEHPRERDEMGRLGRERCLRDWNYEAQFAKVVSALEGPG